MIKNYEEKTEEIKKTIKTLNKGEISEKNAEQQYKKTKRTLKKIKNSLNLGKGKIKIVDKDKTLKKEKI